MEGGIVVESVWMWDETKMDVLVPGGGQWERWRRDGVRGAGASDGVGKDVDGDGAGEDGGVDGWSAVKGERRSVGKG